MGQLIYLVGPSGSGKDSLLRELAHELPPECVILQRIVTRLDTTQSEESVFLSEADFEEQVAKGAFALHWYANGLSYGIGQELNEHLAAGKTVLLNGSRAYWPQVHQRYSSAILAMVRVEPSLLRQRLINRGRETAAEIEARLGRNQRMEQQLLVQAQQSQAAYWEIDNSQPLPQAVNVLRQQLETLLAIG